MLQYMCRGSPLIKQRHLVQVDHHVWEIDEFAGDNQGLIVAEVELEHETQTFTKPSWLGEEVSNEIRYFNFSLINHPFTSW